MSSHCLPNGFLGNKELPVPNISGSTITVFNPPSGLRRGVVVYMHGLYSVPVPVPAPSPVTDVYNSLGSAMVNTLCTNLAYDGWVVIAVPAQEDAFVSIPSGGLYLDVQNDTGFGARYLASTLHTWDHVYQYIQATYGNWPIVVGGASRGGWNTLAIATNRTSQIGGYFAHIPATYWETIGTGYTPGFNFGNLNWSGMDFSATALNAVTVPGIVGYGTSDSAVWYGGSSTIATWNGGTTAGVAAASVTAATVSGGSLNYAAASGRVTFTGLTGGTSGGVATYTYATYAAGAFTTMALVAGSGTMNGSVAVGQSNIDQLIINAIAATRPVTRMSTAQLHSISITDTGAYYAGATTTITALNTLTTLQITPTQASCQTIAAQALISTKCSIMDSTGTWHVVTFSGSTSPNLTGASIAGTGTINAGAPIVNTGTAITGGFSNQSYPYWVSQTLDGTYPKTF